VKRVYTLFIVVLILVFTGSMLYKKAGMISSPEFTAARSGNTYSRIISLSPGITETLFALGLGDRVVGVTRFCNYPPEARMKADVGGYVDPNYEAIAALKPDLVIALAVHEEAVRYLAGMGLKYVTVRNEKTADILNAIMTIGNACGAKNRAQDMVTDIRTRMDAVLEKTRGLSRPRVLISVGRNAGTGSLGDVYAAGHDTFYDELVTCAGGVNAYDGHDIAYPALSAEGILVLNPDIIIDLIPDLVKNRLDETAVLRDWESVPGLRAPENHHIHVVSSDYAVIPGPRFILFLEDLARIIHPELFK
jgi:iron complex transport system substrate-binding protein